MYENVTSKNELVKIICDKICKSNIRCENTDMLGRKLPIEPGQGLFEGFSNIPLNNLRKMAETSFEPYADFHQLYDAWGKAGMLRFKPYVIEKGKSASLCVRHNRYIHMFRGYYFQASGTIDGIGDFGSGSYRTDFLVNVGWDSWIENTLLGYTLWWAALIDVGFKFDNFKELFENDTDVVQSFLHTTMQNWGYHSSSYAWSDVANHISRKPSVENNFIDRAVYQLVENGKVYARFAIGKNTIQVEVNNSNTNVPTLLIFDMKSMIEQVESLSVDDYDIEELMETFEKNHYLEMILVMLLKMCNINLSFINWYKTAHLNALQPLNIPGVKTVESLNDIYKVEPDMF